MSNNFRLRYVLPRIGFMHSCVKSRWVEEKMIWVTAYEEGKSVTEIARSAGVARDTVYKWLERYKRLGPQGLLPQRPGSPSGFHPLRTDSWVIDKIVDIYKEYGNGPRKIVRKLEKEGVKVSHMTVYRHLVGKGVITKRKRKRRRKPNLHVADYPGEEVQLDVMHVDPIAGTEDRLGRTRKGFHYQHTLIDDCTRTQHATLFPNLSQDNTCEFLDRVIGKSPFHLQRIRMDNGSENQSKVRNLLKARKISWIYNQPSRPDQNGKVERVHRTDTQEYYLRSEATSFKERVLGLNKYLLYYNNKRPHFGLGMNGKTPLEKLRTFKQYQSVDLIV